MKRSATVDQRGRLRERIDQAAGVRAQRAAILGLHRGYAPTRYGRRDKRGRIISAEAVPEVTADYVETGRYGGTPPSASG